MENVAIRQIGKSEIPVCASIIRRSFAADADRYGLTKANTPTSGAFLRDEQLLLEYSKGTLMFLLSAAGVPVGFVALEKRDERTFYLEKLAVLPNFRRKGNGKALLDYCKDFVLGKGCDKIFIGINDDNAELRDWYLRNGFSHKGTKTFPRLPFRVGFMEWDLTS